MAMKITVTGLKELERALSELPRAVGRNVLKRAGMNALEPMARLARQIAPKDEYDLSESIGVGASAVTTDAGRAAYASVKKAGGSDADAVVALRDARRAQRSQLSGVMLYMGPAATQDRNDAIKALAQEYGTSFHPPQPYMRPAFDAQADATIQRLAKELAFEVALAAERQARKAAR